jgi:hypothetical protein
VLRGAPRKVFPEYEPLMARPIPSRMNKVFAIDVLACPVCSGRMKLIAYIGNASVARGSWSTSVEDRATAGEGATPGDRGLRPSPGLRTGRPQLGRVGSDGPAATADGGPRAVRGRRGRAFYAPASPAIPNLLATPSGLLRAGQRSPPRWEAPTSQPARSEWARWGLLAVTD